MNRHPAPPALPAICGAIALVVWTSVAWTPGACAQTDVPQSDPTEEAVAAPVVEEPAVAEIPAFMDLATETPPDASLTMEQSIPRDQLSPVVAEIFAALDEDRARIRKFKDELAATNDPARAFELQRAIVAAKQDAEVRMLRIQADHARRQDRADVAAELEGAIETLTTPANGREPAPRAASAAGR